MKIKEANKKNQLTNDGENIHQQVRVVVANHRRGDVKYLQLVKSKRGRPGVSSPPRLSPGAGLNQSNKKDINGLHLIKNKNGRSRVQSPKRNGELTLAPRTNFSRRGRQISRNRRYCYGREEHIASPITSSPLPPISKRVQKSTANDYRSKQTEVILHCPNNYDDDMSSLTDSFRAGKLGKRRGQDVAVSVARRFHTEESIGEDHEIGQHFLFSVGRRCNTTGALGEVRERGQDFSFGLERRNNTTEIPAERTESLCKETSEDDGSIIVPWEDKKKELFGNNHDCNVHDDDDDVGTLLSPLRAAHKHHYDKPSCQSVIVTLSSTSTRGQDEALAMPETGYAFSA